jgi:hypothetical protein
MRPLTAVLASVVFLVSLALTQEEHHHAISEEEIGSVHFLTSCSANLAEPFNRAVVLLHSFQYEQARQAFTEISDRAPQCAMAKWGVAMSHYHGMWDNGDTAAGRLALNQAKQIAASNAKTTPRENDYIDALAEIYREDGKDAYSRSQAFEQKMGALQAASCPPSGRKYCVPLIGSVTFHSSSCKSSSRSTKSISDVLTINRSDDV